MIKRQSIKSSLAVSGPCGVPLLAFYCVACAAAFAFALTAIVCRFEGLAKLEERVHKRQAGSGPSRMTDLLITYDVKFGWGGSCAVTEASWIEGVFAGGNGQGQLIEGTMEETEAGEGGTAAAAEEDRPYRAVARGCAKWGGDVPWAWAEGSDLPLVPPQGREQVDADSSTADDRMIDSVAAEAMLASLPRALPGQSTFGGYMSIAGFVGLALLTGGFAIFFLGLQLEIDWGVGGGGGPHGGFQHMPVLSKMLGYFVLHYLLWVMLVYLFTLRVSVVRDLEVLTEGAVPSWAYGLCLVAVFYLTFLAMCASMDRGLDDAIANPLYTSDTSLELVAKQSMEGQRRKYQQQQLVIQEQQQKQEEEGREEDDDDEDDDDGEEEDERRRTDHDDEYEHEGENEDDSIRATSALPAIPGLGGLSKKRGRKKNGGKEGRKLIAPASARPREIKDLYYDSDDSESGNMEGGFGWQGASRDEGGFLAPQSRSGRTVATAVGSRAHSRSHSRSHSMAGTEESFLGGQQLVVQQQQREQQHQPPLQQEEMEAGGRGEESPRGGHGGGEQGNSMAPIA